MYWAVGQFPPCYRYTPGARAARTDSSVLCNSSMWSLVLEHTASPGKPNVSGTCQQDRCLNIGLCYAYLGVRDSSRTSILSQFVRDISVERVFLMHQSEGSFSQPLFHSFFIRVNKTRLKWDLSIMESRGDGWPRGTLLSKGVKRGGRWETCRLTKFQVCLLQ